MSSEGLAAGRARRHGAGNRMRALLDGVFEAEEGFQEFENDEEFEYKGDGDGDVYDSDFMSSDDEADAELVGETELQAEIRKERRNARKRADRATGSSKPAGLKPSLHSVQKSREQAKPEDAEAEADLDGDAEATDDRPAKKRRFSQPIPIDESGELVDLATRKSRRSATVKSKKELHEKLKDEQEKRAAQPKKARVTARALTQDELIAEAFKTEELNVASLNDFLTEEEERRTRNANLKRETIDGPMLRFYSRGEKVKVPMIVEVEIPTPPSSYMRPYVTAPPLSGPNGARTIPNATGASSSLSPYYSSPLANPYPTSSSPAMAGMAPPPKGPSTITNPYSSSPYYRPLAPPPSRPTNVAVPTPTPPPTFVQQTRNYIILDTPGAKPEEDYKYIFGDHVDWGSLKVLPKNRPNVRKSTACPITGLPARYLDPATGIPYANLHGYRTIQDLLRNRYVWSDGLDCYVGDQERTEGATGVPDGWEDIVAGRKGDEIASGAAQIVEAAGAKDEAIMEH